MSSSWLGFIHRAASRNALLVRVARKVRNQANAVIRLSLNDGIDPRRNGELLLIDRIAPFSRTFVDVGANVGHWSEEFAQRMPAGGRGVAVEPSPGAAAILRENLSRFAGAIEVVEAAAAEEPGRMTFFAERDAGEKSSAIESFSSASASRIEVVVTTVDDIVDRRGLGFVDFLKIDAEGYDLRVILGARRILAARAVGVVQFEYNAPWALAGSTLAEALRAFGSWGYEVYLLKADGLHRIDYPGFGEYFGYSNFVAVSESVRPRIASLIGPDIR